MKANEAILFVAAVLVAASPVSQGNESETTARVEPVVRYVAQRRSTTPKDGDWPHWRGPNRDGIVAHDSGWDAGRWPPEAPLWKAQVGAGASSPIVVDGRVYVLGWTDGRDHLRCLEAATGRELWQASYEAPKYGRHATGDEGLYSGVTATPEYDPRRGLLYTLGIDGHLACWNPQNGKPVWNLNLYDAYGAGRRDKIRRSSRRDYGYTSSPLIHGDWLIVEAGSPRGTLVGFDKRTGRPIWFSQAQHQAGHSGGPVPMTVDGIPCVVMLTHKCLLVVRLDEGRVGETLAEYPWETEYAQNVPTPAVWQNRVLITSGYNHRSACLLEITRQGARRVWEQPVHSQVCSPVIHAGHVYWVYQSPICLDLETGRQIWEGPRRFSDAGSCVVTADQRLILWSGRGDLVLAETAARSPNTYRELARTPTLFRTDVWPHVTLAGGRIYCKDRNGNLACFALIPSGDQAEPMIVDTMPPRREPSASAPPTGETGERPPGDTQLDLDSQLRSWPGTTPGLIVAWQRDGGRNRLISRLSEITENWQLKPRGDAAFDSLGTACLDGGAILVQGPETALLEACRQTGELTLEVRFLTERVRQSGPARILSFSIDGYRRNWTLGQEGDQLLFRLRTPATGENGMNPQTALFRIEAREPEYLVISYRDGELTAYRNGRRVLATSKVRGDFRNWTPQYLLLGDEYAEPRPWLGRIERFAIHSRAIDEREVRLRDRLIRGPSRN